MFGLEELLAKELEEQGAEEITMLKRAISFEGDLEVLYKANLYSRTALRILKPIYSFTAHNENHLYKKIMDYDWGQHLDVNQTFMISSVVNSERFRHSQYLSLKIKDAIVDQFREKLGKRPSIDLDQPDVRISVYLNHINFEISIDSSGDSLHKRGFRSAEARAPLNEVLAAGMIKLSGWTADKPLYIPMCGSGTLAIEAAMIAKNQAPGLWRTHFGFMNWDDYDHDLWKSIKQTALRKVKKTDAQIFASDHAFWAIENGKKSSEKARLDEIIHFHQNEFDQVVPQEEGGVLLLNPPYGQRMEVADIEDLYSRIGDHFKKNFTGFEAWIISSNKDALKRIGLRPAKKLTLYNGPLECKFQKYELYKGSKKAKKQT